MGSGFSKMKKQARLLEQQYAKAREELKQKEYEGSSGNGLVTLTFNGEKELKKVHLKPECVSPADVEGLQDLILAAARDAYRKISLEEKDSMAPGMLDL
jgi:nucleoid-associated protein EbfC